MRLPHHIVPAILLLAHVNPAFAQYEGGIEIPENVLEAILELNDREPGDPEDVVVLDPADGDEKPQAVDADPEDTPDIDDVVAAVLAEDQAQAAPVESPSHGPAVRVQPLRDLGGAKVSAADIRIHAPFAAKPLGRPSDGWKLISSPDVPVFNKNVEVAPGAWLTLAIRPHILVPEADGQNVFQINEPGFDPDLGYVQKATISASIASSIRQLEEDSKLLGAVIDDLEQILISLPRHDRDQSTNDTNR